MKTGASMLVDTKVMGTTVDGWKGNAICFLLSVEEQCQISAAFLDVRVGSTCNSKWGEKTLCFNSVAFFQNISHFDCIKLFSKRVSMPFSFAGSHCDKNDGQFDFSAFVCVIQKQRDNGHTLSRSFQSSGQCRFYCFCTSQWFLLNCACISVSISSVQREALRSNDTL